MIQSAEDLLSQLLVGAVDQLDIPPELALAAEKRYKSVGAELAKEGADVYVQGSFRIGTVVRPQRVSGEYDIDLVCNWSVDKDTITKQQLREHVGDLLLAYVDTAAANVTPDDVPKACDEGRRCWTLKYHNFHLDVLPAIPDRASASSTAILLTDKQLLHWQHSDPIAYADWFFDQCRKELEAKQLAASASRGSVEDVPEWTVRTTLHRVVQVLKMHRDIHFADDVDDRPPSSLITTLAALAYPGERSVLDAAVSSVQLMPRFIEDRYGTAWVVNPVAEGENFADKWAQYPARRAKFLRWLDQVGTDLREASEARTGGLPAVVARLEKSFGAPVREAANVYGDEMRLTRERGALTMVPSGVLAVASAGAGGRVVRDHRFYGAAETSTA